MQICGKVHVAQFSGHTIGAIGGVRTAETTPHTIARQNRERPLIF